MLASPVPIYLGVAGLIVGSLGLGAQYLVGGNAGIATDATTERPPFARSVEQASLPATPWTSPNPGAPNPDAPNPGVAHYGPMVELLTQPTRSTEPTRSAEPTAQASAAQQQPEPRREQASTAAPREIVRDGRQQQARQPGQTRNARVRDEARTGNDPRMATEPDARDDRAEVPRRRYDRRTRSREESEVVDTRSRSDRRRFEPNERRPRVPDPRVVIREETSEPERFVRGGEPREGFTPFQMFGIVDER
jgi:hypothetical protein